MPNRPPPPKAAPLPTRDEVLRFIRESPTPVGKREIARAFGIKGALRQELKDILRDWRDEGALEAGEKRRTLLPAGSLPPVTVVVVTGEDLDGEPLVRPQRWDSDQPPPRIVLAPSREAGRMGRGERALVKLKPAGDGSTAHTAHVIKRLPSGGGDSVLGIVRQVRGRHRLVPTDRRAKEDYDLAQGDLAGAEPGELVLADVIPGRRLGLKSVRVAERLGDGDHPKSLSLIAIHAHGLPNVFPAAVLAEAEAALPVAPGRNHEDLRAIPLVTIDGEDARDFDDAVWAEAAAEGGWDVIVAIADVAHYVQPGGALDREAMRRGNSAYFPDRVVPMLPEALSNGLCSLKPDEDRACLAVRMSFDAQGHKRRHRFVRGVMRSAARLTYHQAQAAIDGRPDDIAGPLLDRVIKPLYQAWAAVHAARRKREPLDLDLPERKVLVGEDGRVTGVALRERFDSHRLIEDFMIAANVAAAETLEARRQPCMYRIHEEPPREKLVDLAEFLKTLNLSLSLGQVIRPALFNRVLAQVAEGPLAPMVNDVILRSQTQAYYGPGNLGHFGLALARYAHFTSPIRRYSDLLVHRGLIRGLGFGDGGLSDEEAARFKEIGEQISLCERRAMAAEREAVDRFCAAWLADKVGQVLPGRISGVTRFGLFIRLSESGADGLIPIAQLGQDYYRHDEALHRLVGQNSGQVFSLGDKVEAEIRQADPLTGSLTLGLAGHTPTTEPLKPSKRGGSRPFKPGRQRRS